MSAQTASFQPHTAATSYGNKMPAIRYSNLGRGNDFEEGNHGHQLARRFSFEAEDDKINIDIDDTRKAHCANPNVTFSAIEQRVHEAHALAKEQQNAPPAISAREHVKKQLAETQSIRLRKARELEEEVCMHKRRSSTITSSDANPENATALPTVDVAAPAPAVTLPPSPPTQSPSAPSPVSQVDMGSPSSKPNGSYNLLPQSQKRYRAPSAQRQQQYTHQRRPTCSTPISLVAPTQAYLSPETARTPRKLQKAKTKTLLAIIEEKQAAEDVELIKGAQKPGATAIAPPEVTAPSPVEKRKSCSHHDKAPPIPRIVVTTPTGRRVRPESPLPGVLPGFWEERLREVEVGEPGYDEFGCEVKEKRGLRVRCKDRLKMLGRKMACGLF